MNSHFKGISISRKDSVNNSNAVDEEEEEEEEEEEDDDDDDDDGNLRGNYGMTERRTDGDNDRSREKHNEGTRV